MEKTVNIEYLHYDGNLHNLHLELLVDAEYREAEFDSLDTGVGISTVKVSPAGFVVNDIHSTKVVGVENEKGNFGKFDLGIHKKFIQKNMDMLTEKAEEVLNENR